MVSCLRMLRHPVLACAVSALLLSACGGRVELLAALSEDEANEALSALLHAHVDAEKVPGKDGVVSLRVDADQVAAALDTLRGAGLPRQRFEGLGQVFKKEGLISSPLEERARYLYGLSQELESTLSHIDGVLTARVHVVLAQSSSGGDPFVPASASVFVKHQRAYNLDTLRPQIRRLVANSISGLSPDKVEIVFVAYQSGKNADTASAPPARPAPAPAAGNWQSLVAWGAALTLALALGGGGWWWWRARAQD